MKSYGQAGQDLFAEMLVRGTTEPRTYLDLGCNLAVYLNNTYALELAGWKGLGIDNGDFHNEHTAYRKNDFLQADVTTIDWDPIIEKYYPNRKIDYISFDVDDATLPAFEHFPFSTVRFKVMTIEHDAYRIGNQLRDTLRSKLSAHGYTLLCGDVICEGFGAFEDWWADLSEVDVGVAIRILCNNTPSSVIKQKLFQPMRYVSGGLLGDFIHQLSVICENWNKTGQRGQLYISDEVGDAFHRGAEATYKDIFPIVSSLPYIESFEVYRGQPFDVNLSAWRGVPGLYSKSWQEIYAVYGVNWGEHQWIYGCTSKPEFENTIVVSTTPTPKRFNTSINWKEFLGSFSLPIVFLENAGTNGYDHFCETTGVTLPMYTANNFTDLVNVIYSCKKFIGTLSMPLAVADAMKKDRIAVVVPESLDAHIARKTNPSVYP